MSMFGSPKPMGSLSSGLLARKGQARPAMRSQGYGGFGSVGQGIDDLGWNDMGAGKGDAPSQPEAVQSPAPSPEPPIAADNASIGSGKVPTFEATIPVVLVQRELLEAQVASPGAVKSVSVATATRIRRETQRSGKASFTLRVEADRHLRLRLASAITNRSAQDLVTEALDALLAAVPEVEALVAQLPPAKRTR